MNINITATRPKPLVLIILDGLGITEPNSGNAVTLAKTPNLNNFWNNYPHYYLQASGNYVGLPAGVVGNSEVGHMGLGAGKIVFQEIARIDNAIEYKTFFKNEMFIKAIDFAKQNNGRLHLMGLTSDGNVHAALNHLYASLELCKQQGLKGKQVRIHAFTDGRDSPPDSARKFLAEIDQNIKKYGVGVIASIIGRYYSMDRDNRWDRTQLAYDMIVNGKGTQVANWKEALDKSYKDAVMDEYVLPYVVMDGDTPLAGVSEGDSVIFFNYRADRAVQLSKAFVDENFSGWDRPKLNNVFFAGFSNYQKGVVMNRAAQDVEQFGDESKMIEELFELEMKKPDERFPENQIFPPEKVEFSLGRMISDAGLSQLRITESEKFPHVTYFFNCREKQPFKREDRIEIPSPKDVPTYDLKPQMSAYEVTKEVAKHILKGTYDFILINYALTDMVAHTGNLEASVRAVEVADECIGYLSKAVLPRGGEIILTSDHGNIEELINIQTGEPDTQHSLNPVPFIYLTNKQFPFREQPMGTLADVAPTLLTLLGIQKPDGMIGRNLFE